MSILETIRDSLVFFNSQVNLIMMYCLYLFLTKLCLCVQPAFQGHGVAPVLKRNLHHYEKGIYVALYREADFLQSYMTQHGRGAALKLLGISTLQKLGVSKHSLNSELSLQNRMEILFDQLCELSCKQAEITSDPGKMTSTELEHYN